MTCNLEKLVLLVLLHTGQAYVKMGLINCLYIKILFLVVSALLLLNIGLSAAMAASPFERSSIMCLLNLSLESRCKPRYLTLDFHSTFLPCSLWRGGGKVCLRFVNIIDSVLFWLILIFHFSKYLFQF